MKNRFIEKMGYIVKIVIAFPIAFIKKSTLKKNSIWLIGIEYDRYENNCKVFFEYLNRKRENVYWVLNKKNKNEMTKYISEEQMIFRGTIKNYVYAFFARVGVYSASDFDIAPGLYKLFCKNTCLVNLSHGYDAIKKMDPLYYQRMPVDIIICASKNEQQFKIENCSAEEEKTVVTGFARCDEFECKSPEKIKNIMIMPTWRDWYLEEKRTFDELPLYITYKRLLEKMENDLKFSEPYHIYFLLHPVMADFFEQKELYKSDTITYIFEPSKITYYLKKSDLLITDYSSISFDYLYMKKPVIFFWFDYEDYSEKRGLFKDIDSFERICFTDEEVIKTITDISCNKTKYYLLDRNKYWDFFDKKNSERIYNTILRHKKYIFRD